MAVSADSANSPPQSTSPQPTTNTTAADDKANAAQIKRKPSRRANTAERRATHNAVERQRRETLNGRFLDLAALLPNLSQIRRPSKSSIVNSSIAHIHASRRHRLLAARELRLLKQESDALRREINEWRDRAGIPRIDEPARTDSFAMIMSGELEVIPPPMGPGVEMDDDDDEDGLGPLGPMPAQYSVNDDVLGQIDEEIAAIQPVYNTNPFAHNIPYNYPPAPQQQSWSEMQHQQQQQQQQQQQHQHQQMMAARSLYTPPATSHGLSPPASPPHLSVNTSRLSVSPTGAPSPASVSSAGSSLHTPVNAPSAYPPNRKSPVYEMGYGVPRYGMGMAYHHPPPAPAMHPAAGATNGMMMMMM